MDKDGRTDRHASAVSLRYHPQSFSVPLKVSPTKPHCSRPHREIPFPDVMARPRAMYPGKSTWQLPLATGMLKTQECFG